MEEKKIIESEIFEENKESQDDTTTVELSDIIVDQQAHRDELNDQDESQKEDQDQGQGQGRKNDLNQEKLLTQSQVNEIAARARQEGRDKAMQELLQRYGVSNESEIEDYFGKGQKYDALNDDYTSQGKLYKEALSENALLRSGIDANRYDDVRLILNGKGLEVTEDNIKELIPTHPEWMGKEPKKIEIRKLGTEVAPEKTGADEEAMVLEKLFGIRR